MVSITAAARANLLQLIGANSEQDKIGSQLITGKRVQSVSDNAFSFFQSRGLDSRVAELSTINDRLNIGVQAMNQAAAAGKKIVKNLESVKGLLDDIKSKGASAQVNTSTVSGNALSIFNRAGSVANPINDATALAASAELGLAADAGKFTKAGLSSSSALIGTTGVDLAADDIIAVKVGNKSIFAKVSSSATQTGDGTSETNAITVQTLGDLANALSGKRKDGVTDISSDPLGGAAFGVFVRPDQGDSALKVSSTSSAKFTIKTQAGVNTYAASKILFGGTADTAVTDFSNTTTSNNLQATTVAANVGTNDFAMNDIVSIDVGSGTNIRTLFMKVVGSFSGTGGGQAGNGAGNGTGLDSPLEIRNIGDFRNAINGLNSNGVALADQGFVSSGISATFNSSSPTGAANTRLTLTAAAPIKMNIDRFGAVAATVNNIFGGTVGTLTSTIGLPGRSSFTAAQTVNTQAKEQRLSVAKSYRATLDTLQGLVDDAQVNGINMLKNTAGYTAKLSETTTTNFALRSVISGDATLSLGFAKIANVYQDGAEADFATNTDVDKAILKLDNALSSLGGRDIELEVFKAILTERKSYNSDVTTALGDLSTDLTAVNQEEASAQAQAASFSSNAALKFLGVSSQRANQLLQIF